MFSSSVSRTALTLLASVVCSSEPSTPRGLLLWRIEPSLDYEAFLCHGPKDIYLLAFNLDLVTFLTDKLELSRFL